MVSLALQDAYLQVPLITIRVVIFASWWEKGRTSSGSSASVSHPRTKSSWGLWLPFPPSSTSMDDWLILASSELVTSISRRGDSVFAFFGSTSSRRVGNLLRLLEEFVNLISSSVPLASYPGPQGPLEFPGRPVSGLLVPSLSRVSSLVDSSGPAAWRSIFLSSSPRRQLLIRRFGCGLRALIGEHHA